MAKSLGGFLTELGETSPDGLLVVDKKVQPANFDVTAILEHLTQRRILRPVLFRRTENLLGQDSAFPIVSNVFGTRELCARALGVPADQSRMGVSLEYARREQRQVEPVTVAHSEAAVKEVVLRGEAADLRILPIIKHFEMDLSPVLTMTSIMRDPDEGFYDVSFIKTFYLDDQRHCGISIHSPHFGRILKKYEERNMPAPFVTVLGHHPAFYLGALALSPWGTDDYHRVGAFLEEPLRLTPSETWGADFLVPADAEIILEGEIPPGVREVVDPFGEVTRHYQPQCLRQAMDLTAITHRKNAIMQDVFSGHEGHWNLGAIPKEGSLFNSLQRRHGCIQAVHLPHSGCGRFACYISIKKEAEGIAKRVAMSALDESWLFQWVVVVDHDIDVFNEQDVLWSVFTNVDPSRDVDVVKNAFNSFVTALGYQKVMIDATRPLDMAFPERIAVPRSAMDRVRLEDYLPSIASSE